MNLQEIKDYIQIKLNKNQNGWVLTPDRYNILLGFMNIDYFENNFMKPGRQPKEGYEKNKESIDLFRVFKTRVNVPLTANIDSAVGSIPENYRHFSSVYFNLYYNKECNVEIKPRKVTYVKDDQLSDRLQSAIQNPTLEYPIWTFLNDEIHVYPNTVRNIEFTYLRMPLLPVFDYTIEDDTVVYLPPGTDHPNSSVKPVGTPSASVEVEYPENYHVEIADWLYEIASTTLKDQLNIQLATQKNQTK